MALITRVARLFRADTLLSDASLSWGRIVKLTGQSAGAQAAAKRVAQVLGTNLSVRKAGQVAPFVGAFLAGTIYRWLGKE